MLLTSLGHDLSIDEKAMPIWDGGRDIVQVSGARSIRF